MIVLFPFMLLVRILFKIGRYVSKKCSSNRDPYVNDLAYLICSSIKFILAFFAVMLVSMPIYLPLLVIACYFLGIGFFTLPFMMLLNCRIGKFSRTLMKIEEKHRWMVGGALRVMTWKHLTLLAFRYKRRKPNVCVIIYKIKSIWINKVGIKQYE